MSSSDSQAPASYAGRKQTWRPTPTDVDKIRPIKMANQLRAPAALPIPITHMMPHNYAVSWGVGYPMASANTRHTYIHVGKIVIRIKNVFFFFLRQGFSLQPWLSWNSPRRTGWPQTHVSTCPMWHHALLNSNF